MSKLSASQKASLQRAAELYHSQLDDEAYTYLEGRMPAGLGVEEQLEAVRSHLLGVVREPAPGHEDYVGRLCLPYLTPSGVVALRFRCLRDHDCKDVKCAKYLDLGHQETRLYNVAALRLANDTLLVTSGELDAWSATVVGFPAVGISGDTKWKPHWSRNLEDFEEVVAVCDGDKSGREFGKRITTEVERARAVHMPAGHDTNSILVEYGAEAFRDLVAA